MKFMEATHTLRRVLVGTAMAVVICGGLWATTSSGTRSTLGGPSATYKGFKVEREAVEREGVDGERAAEDGWAVKIEAKDGLSVSTQTITFQPGGQSGWD